MIEQQVEPLKSLYELELPQNHLERLFTQILMDTHESSFYTTRDSIVEFCGAFIESKVLTSSNLVISNL